VNGKSYLRKNRENDKLPPQVKYTFEEQFKKSATGATVTAEDHQQASQIEAKVV